MARKTLFCLIDTETTMKNGMVFDFAYHLVDKNGQTYEKGSYLFTDVLAIEEPFYKEKIAQYWKLVYKKHIQPGSLRAVRHMYNAMLQRYQGFKIVIAAYNAAFDTSHLALTSHNLLKKPWLWESNKNVLFFDLWHGWIVNCPVEYGYTAPFTVPAKGRPMTYNIQTSAEAVYKYISGNDKFKEKHIAYADLIIELVILLDIIKRKKKMHIVDHPKHFVSMPWKLAQQRCRGPIEFRKAKQLSMAEIIEQVPEAENESVITFPETELVV